jgi:hypothetical protein
MTLSISSPLTGAAQTGLTSPTYTLSSDVGPNNHSIQYAVTALGGTQAGVEAHSVSKPFTITVERPANFKMLGRLNPVTGTLGSVPRNVYKVRTRKGVEPLEGQAFVPAMVETVIYVPAGSDEADPESVRAMLSAHIGTLNNISAALGSTCVTGVL